jgi:peroxiredoxin
MKRVVLYVADKCPHCKDAQRYLDSKKIAYRLGDQVMVGWNQKNFDKMYNS